jgi:hypothetical protein
MDSGDREAVKYLWADTSVEELAELLCVMFSGEPGAQRPEIMPACVMFAEGLKTLTPDDSRTIPIITLVRRIIDTDGEGIDNLEPLFRKFIALRQ